jgi:hypothetical protein
MTSQSASLIRAMAFSSDTSRYGWTECLKLPSHMLHVWYIYLQNWVIIRANVGKYTEYTIHGAYGHCKNEILGDQTVGNLIPSSRAIYHQIQHIFHIESDQVVPKDYNLRCARAQVTKSYNFHQFPTQQASFFKIL